MISGHVKCYSDAQADDAKAVCQALAAEIALALPQAEGKVWHGGPVWFIEGNPVAGYWVRKKGVQLLFWSGQSFDEPGLRPEGKFKAAEANYANASEINPADLRRWLDKAARMQWNYKDIVKRRGVLEKVGDW